MNAATVTPARTRAPVARAAPTERPRTYASTTATVAPAKAATGTSRPDVPTDPYAIAIVAPRPAPAATPSRYGSASGLRKTPWYAEPATASIPPTSPARTTRG